VVPQDGIPLRTSCCMMIGLRKNEIRRSPGELLSLPGRALATASSLLQPHIGGLHSDMAAPNSRRDVAAEPIGPRRKRWIRQYSEWSADHDVRRQNDPSAWSDAPTLSAASYQEEKLLAFRVAIRERRDGPIPIEQRDMLLNSTQPRSLTMPNLLNLTHTTPEDRTVVILQDEIGSSDDPIGTLNSGWDKTERKR
jgi:hypothetical protein